MVDTCILLSFDEALHEYHGEAGVNGHNRSGKGSTKPIGDEFVDSDKAMELAKKSGLKGENPMMGLNVLGTGSTAYWTVTGGYTTGDVSVVLEAKTGKLLRSEVIQGF